MLKWAWKRESKAHIACKSHVFFPAHWRVGEFYNMLFATTRTLSDKTLTVTPIPTQTNANSSPVTTATILYIRSRHLWNFCTCITVVQYTIRVAQKAMTTLRRLLTNAKDKNKPEDWRNIKSTESLRHVLHCTYSTDYYCQRLSSKSWFTNLEQTPLNRSQQLQATYKGLIDGFLLRNSHCQ